MRLYFYASSVSVIPSLFHFRLKSTRYIFPYLPDWFHGLYDHFTDLVSLTVFFFVFVFTLFFHFDVVRLAAALNERWIVAYDIIIFSQNTQVVFSSAFGQQWQLWSHLSQSHLEITRRTQVTPVSCIARSFPSCRLVRVRPTLLPRPSDIKNCSTNFKYVWLSFFLSCRLRDERYSLLWEGHIALRLSHVWCLFGSPCDVFLLQIGVAIAAAATALQADMTGIKKRSACREITHDDSEADCRPSSSSSERLSTEQNACHHHISCWWWSR